MSRHTIRVTLAAVFTLLSGHSFGQVKPGCEVPLGSHAPGLFLTDVIRTGSRGPGSRAHIMFQASAPDTMTLEAVLINDAEVSRSTGDVSASGDLWFTVPAPGTYSLKVKVRTAFGCELTRAWSQPFIVAPPVVVPPPPPPPPPMPSPHTQDRANSYDDAWQPAWVAHLKAVITTPTPGIRKTWGKVLHSGDSFVVTQAYGAWTTNGAGQTAEDRETALWMNAQSSGNDNGLNLAHGLVTAGDGDGWGNPKTAAIPTNPATNDAILDVIAYNVSDIGIVERDLDTLLAAGIFPVLRTVPPRNVAGYDEQYTIPFNNLLRALAQRKALPIVDAYQEFVLRQPVNWATTLISDDWVHPSASRGGFTEISDPYANGGDQATKATGAAAAQSGFNLLTWLVEQKLTEVRLNMPPDPPTPPVAGLPTRLYQQADFSDWTGAFSPPLGVDVDTTYDFAAKGLTLSKERQSFFMNGHIQRGRTGEFGIPEIRKADTFAQLAIAPTKQLLSWVFPFLSISSPGNNAAMWGLLALPDKLCGTAVMTYDANNTQRKSLWCSPLAPLGYTATTEAFSLGPPTRQGFTAGYMGWIPQEWRAAIGWPAFAGQCCLSIIGRTSNSATLIGFDPADVGTKDPLPTEEFMWTNEDHPDSGHWHGEWGAPGTFVNGLTAIGGCVWIDDSRTIACFGRQGTGPWCYGFGTPDPKLAFTIVPPQFTNDPNLIYCWDPFNSDKGQHGYPYELRVWLYDGLDLLQVKRGIDRPWDVKPYAMFRLDWPLMSLVPEVNGVVYDKETRRLYVAVWRHSTGSNMVIHVVTVKP